MTHWKIHFSPKGDSDWEVLRNGVPVAWFMGTNACERFIAREQAAERAIARTVSKAERRRLDRLVPPAEDFSCGGWFDL